MPTRVPQSTGEKVGVLDLKPAPRYSEATQSEILNSIQILLDNQKRLAEAWETMMDRLDAVEREIRAPEATS